MSSTLAYVPTMHRVVQTVCGLDPATICGWSIMLQLDDGSVTHHASGVANLAARGLRGMVGVADSLAFSLGMWNLLSELHEEHRFTAIAYEHVESHTGVHAAQIYGGHRAAIRLWAYQLMRDERREDESAQPMEVIAVPVQAGKKALTGKGSATKQQSEAWARKRFGVLCQTHDQADAIGIGIGGIEMLKSGKRVKGA